MAKPPLVSDDSDPIITWDLREKINEAVRGLPLSGAEKRELAGEAGVGVREAQLWFAPSTAKVSRPLVPDDVLGKRLSELTGPLARFHTRVSLGLGVTGEVTQRPEPGGNPAVYHEAFPTLGAARDRVDQHVERAPGIAPFLARHWERIRLFWDPNRVSEVKDPKTGEIKQKKGAWTIEVEYDQFGDES